MYGNSITEVSPDVTNQCNIKYPTISRPNSYPKRVPAGWSDSKNILTQPRPNSFWKPVPGGKPPACKHPYKQAFSHSSKASKYRLLSTKSSITKSLLEHSSGFKPVHIPKAPVLPTKPAIITTTPSEHALKKHVKQATEAAKVVESTNEKSKDEKRKAYFSQGTTLAASFEEKKK